jgi:hypothetical protein
MPAPIEQRVGADRGEYLRTAFGLALSIDSRISIPGLGEQSCPVARESPSHIRLDPKELERRWATVTAAPERTRELRFGEELLLSVDVAEPAGYLMWARGLGRALISRDGSELLCDPDPTRPDWMRMLVAQALPLAATVRGLEVLHASAVVLDGRAVLFAGPVGAGKSSLAAAFVRAGAQLVGDDVATLELDEQGLTVYPGSAVLQLRDAEDEALSAQAREALGERMPTAAGKHRYVSERMPDPAPLGAVFLLERSAAEPAVERLAAVSPFELIASTFNLSVRTPARLQRQLDVVSAIAKLGLAHRLRVQPDVDAETLASIVQAELAAPTR